MTNVLNVSQKIVNVTNQIAKTNKRHMAILSGILHKKQTTPNNKIFNHAVLSEYLKNKFKLDEGIILSFNFYNTLFRKFPKEQDIADLQFNLEKQGLNVIPVYKVMEEEQSPTAIFIVIHTELYKAVEYADEIKTIILGSKPSPKSTMVMTALKITEYLAKDNIDIARLCSALTLLAGDEVYCVSMNYFMKYRIDPNELEKLMEAQGFKICRLLNSEERVETIKEYMYYDGLEGLLISRTDAGIKLAQDNFEIMKIVCNTAEAGIPEAASTMH